LSQVHSRNSRSSLHLVPALIIAAATVTSLFSKKVVARTVAGFISDEVGGGVGQRFTKTITSTIAFITNNSNLLHCLMSVNTSITVTLIYPTSFTHNPVTTTNVTIHQSFQVE
jgi:hypothetical protein